MDLPNIIETPDFQQRLSENLDHFTARCRATIPDYDRPTPADPAYHLIVEITLLSVIITEKINAAAYTQLLKLSNDIDFIFKGKIRQGETPAAYRERMRGTRDQACPAGTNAMYKALTFLFGEATIGAGKDAVSASVIDAYVQSVNGELLIHVLINSDVPALKSAVVTRLTEAFKLETVKPALDAVTFIEARSVPYAISATITLQPGYGPEQKETIEKTFREKVEAEKKLGWVPAVSWIVRELHQTAVKSLILTSPVTNIPVPPDRYAVISSLDLSVETSS